MQTVFPPTRDSIFGDTYGGVPNPNVPHVHPWPTRYHGPNYTVPGQPNAYVERPYAKVPYFGIGAAPIFDLSGSQLADAAVGAALGYVASPTKDSKVMWAVVGGIATYVAGTVGLLGTGIALYLARNK